MSVMGLRVARPPPHPSLVFMQVVPPDAHPPEHPRNSHDGVAWSAGGARAHVDRDGQRAFDAHDAPFWLMFSDVRCSTSDLRPVPPLPLVADGVITPAAPGWERTEMPRGRGGSEELRTTYRGVDWGRAGSG